MKKLKIQNKSMFYSGIVMQIIQFFIVGLIILMSLDYSWFTFVLFKKLMLIGVFVLYNALSLIMIMLNVGSNKK